MSPIPKGVCRCAYAAPAVWHDHAMGSITHKVMYNPNSMRRQAWTSKIRQRIYDKRVALWHIPQVLHGLQDDAQVRLIQVRLLG